MTLRRSDLQGGVHLVREHPTKAIRHKEAHPSEINREVIRRTISYVRRALDPNPNVLLHCTRLASEAKANSKNNSHTLQQEKTTPLPGNQPAALLTSEGPRTRLRSRGAHTRYSHEVGSTYKPEGYSRHSPDQFSHFNYLA